MYYSREWINTSTLKHLMCVRYILLSSDIVFDHETNIWCYKIIICVYEKIIFVPLIATHIVTTMQ
jgi:hypothetical protein